MQLISGFVIQLASEELVYLINTIYTFTHKHKIAELNPQAMNISYLRLVQNDIKM